MYQSQYCNVIFHKNSRNDVVPETGLQWQWRGGFSSSMRVAQVMEVASTRGVIKMMEVKVPDPRSPRGAGSPKGSRAGSPKGSKTRALSAL